MLEWITVNENITAVKTTFWLGYGQTEGLTSVGIAKRLLTMVQSHPEALTSGSTAEHLAEEVAGLKALEATVEACEAGNGPEPIMELDTTMTLVVEDGKVAVISPAAPSPETFAKIDALGTVTALVSPNVQHWLFMEAYTAQYPAAKVFLSDPALGEDVAAKLPGSIKSVTQGLTQLHRVHNIFPICAGLSGWWTGLDRCCLAWKGGTCRGPCKPCTKCCSSTLSQEHSSRQTPSTLGIPTVQTTGGLLGGLHACGSRSPSPQLGTKTQPCRFTAQPVLRQPEAHQPYLTALTGCATTGPLTALFLLTASRRFLRMPRPPFERRGGRGVTWRHSRAGWVPRRIRLLNSLLLRGYFFHCCRGHHACAIPQRPKRSCHCPES